MPVSRVPVSGVPDTGVPDAGVPDAGVPGTGLPGKRMPGTRTSDTRTSDARTSDARMPGTRTSGTRMSGTQTSDTQTSGTRTSGASWEPVELTAPWAAGRLVLDGAEAERLGGPEAYEDVRATARTAFAGLQAGVCAGSLARAVEYTNQREQFGRPLAAKQGVQLRAADAHMDVEAIRVTAYEAAWRRDEGLAYRSHALTTAWWASEGGRRVVHTGQHLHGGMGADLEHPVHRHFLWGRQLDGYLGGGREVLEELGDLIVGESA
ncbi:acyl-CoA dehydrogenase family protein [Streptomyces kunmingensis]